MRNHPTIVFAVLMLLILIPATILHAQEMDGEEHDFFTVSGGWSWPVGGPVQDQYQSGLTLAASFTAGLADNYLGGFEFGYSWYSLDTAWLGEQTPGSTYSGGDMGLLSITTENDYIMGAPQNPMRPFLNLGIGYYKSFIDDATVTSGGSSQPYSTGVYKGSFFGFHAGIGGLINKDRFGLRVDVNYQHLFAGGPDLEFFSVRGGFIFYLQTATTSTKTGTETRGG